MPHLVFVLLLSAVQGVFPCSWETAVEVGSLNDAIDEASGLAISRRFPDRAYRINDSGDRGRFFVSGIDGRNLQTVNVRGFRPIDVEDLGIGPCALETDCLLIGDIGDNSRTRDYVEIVVVQERVEYPAEIEPLRRVRMKYPDGPHDAESLAVHPDGNVYIMTKDFQPQRTSFTLGAARIYRLSPEQWRQGGGGEQTLEHVLTFDMRRVLSGILPPGQIPTAMDIAPDGKRFIVLTYLDAAEFLLDLSEALPQPETWRNGEHFRKIILEYLEQQESIAYEADGRAFVYDTERPLRSRAARIMRVGCEVN